SALVGLFEPILSSGVSLVNARSVAKERGIEVIETRSARPRSFTNLLSVKLQTSEGERWVEGTAFEQSGPRLVLLDGIPVEAPLDGTLIVLRNQDLPGVIGEVGTVLGRSGVNIANFALGRDANGAIGVVNVDERANGQQVNETIVGELSKVPAIKDVRVV